MWTEEIPINIKVESQLRIDDKRKGEKTMSELSHLDELEAEAIYIPSEKTAQ